MDKKYRIGFFAVVAAVVIILCVLYQVSYDYTIKREYARSEALLQSETETNRNEKEKSLSVKGSATKNEGYYLKNLQGYVVVYYRDQSTIYEMTEIAVDSLPSEVQGELLDGKYVETTEELYAFLQNYSS